MLRVLLLGSHLNYNLEHYVKLSLTRSGREVRFLGYRNFLGRLADPARITISRGKVLRRLWAPLGLQQYNTACERTAHEFEPDLILAIKGEAILPTTIDHLSTKLRVPTALWFPDDPRYFESFAKHVAPHYDFVFTSSERSLPVYRSVGVREVAALPFACEPTVHMTIGLSQLERRFFESDVCFVGSFSRKRARIIDCLEKVGLTVNVWGPYWRYFKHTSNFHGPIVGPNLARAFNAAKLVLNVHEDSDLGFKPNMRVFEATACGTLLLTDKPFGLETFFSLGSELLSYDNEVELTRLAVEYTQLSSERLAISTKAQERAYRDHTYDERIERLLKTVS